MKPLTAERLRELFTYNPETGHFRRLKNAKTAQYRANYRGYIRLQIEGRYYKTSRLAWLYMTGDWPDGIVDHANRNRADDRWINLRLATFAQNSFNTMRCSKNGLPRGVWKNRGKWSAKIRVAGDSLYLGAFNTPEEAAAAYDVAATFHHGEFAVLNGEMGWRSETPYLYPIAQPGRGYPA